MNAFTRNELNELNSGRYGLTMDQVNVLAPSIFASEKHESRSKHYAYISTAKTLRALMDEGFVPTKVMRRNCRDADRQAYTKHLIRLRRRQDIERAAVVGETVNEILFANAHDGTSAYVLRIGCFRFVCANGMVVGDNTMTLKVYHKGKEEEVNDKVITAAYEVTGLFDKVNEQKELMQSRTLTLDNKLDFAKRALELRYVDAEHAPITRSDLLTARRYEDTGDNLWSVFNRVQENLLNGGIQPNIRGKRRTRPITNIDKNLSVNRGLWNLAMEYAG